MDLKLDVKFEREEKKKLRKQKITPIDLFLSRTRHSRRNAGKIATIEGEKNGIEIDFEDYKQSNQYSIGCAKLCSCFRPE